MGDPFDFRSLRIRQPRKWLPDRAKYEIFSADRQLQATVTETEGHTVLKLLSKAVPDTRVFAVTTADGEPVLSLTKLTSQWTSELCDPEGELIGRIRTGETRRIYTLLDDHDHTVAKVTGDLALKHFTATGTDHREFARVRKTWAGLTKEMLTPSDHYKVEFTGPVSPPGRILTVMMPIVLDLTLYGPD